MQSTRLSRLSQAFHGDSIRVAARVATRLAGCRCCLRSRFELEHQGANGVIGTFASTTGCDFGEKRPLLGRVDYSISCEIRRLACL
jgi:hypothetical protein